MLSAAFEVLSVQPSKILPFYVVLLSNKDEKKVFLLIQNLHFKNYRVSQKKIGFRNVVLCSLKGVLTVKIRVFWGAEHTYAMTRCLAHVSNFSSLEWSPIYLLSHL